MKKYAVLGLLMICVLSASGCCRTVNRIDFVIPAGTESQVIYSEMEVSPRRDHIEVRAGEHMGDTTVWLQQVGIVADGSQQGEYLTGGVTVRLSAQKGQWYKIAFIGHNPTDADLKVSVIVADAEVRVK